MTTKQETYGKDELLCSACGEAKKQTDFYKSPTKRGWEVNCKDCRKLARAKAKEPSKETALEALKTLEEIKLTVDFTGYPKIFKTLLERARRSFRTPELQLMKLLYEQLQEKEAVKA